MSATETIAPVAGLSLDTAPRSWAGNTATVTVAGKGLAWSPSTELALESQELQADGSFKDWRPLVRFKGDDRRELSIPPGNYRWHLSQDSSDSHRRAWEVSVTRRSRRPNA